MTIKERVLRLERRGVSSSLCRDLLDAGNVDLLAQVEAASPAHVEDLNAAYKART